MSEESKETTSISNSDTVETISDQKQEIDIYEQAEKLVLGQGNDAEEEQDDEASNESDDNSTDEQSSSKEQSSEDSKKSSQPDDSESTDNENKVDSVDVLKSRIAELENQLSKTSKSYKSLEPEFTRKSQKLKQTESELTDKEQKLAALEREIKLLKGEADVRTSVIDTIREKNPDAANLLSQIKKEAIAEAKAEIEKDLKPLKSNMEKAQVDENLGKFQTRLDDFLQSPAKSLEKEFLNVIGEYFSNEQELANSASKDPKLFDKLYKEFVAKYYKQIAELETKTGKPAVSSKERDDEIAKSKGISKSTTSVNAEEDVDLSDPKKFGEMLRKDKTKALAWMKKQGLILKQGIE